MIQKLENGNTLVTLGEGTVFTGNVYANNDNKPFGIYFSNEKEKTNDVIIIQITNEKAIASYIMSLIRLIKAWDIEGDSDFAKVINNIEQDLKPFLPK